MIEESWTNANAYIEVHIDMDAVRRLQVRGSSKRMSWLLEDANVPIARNFIRIYQMGIS